MSKKTPLQKVNVGNLLDDSFILKADFSILRTQLNTHLPKAVEQEIKLIYKSVFPEGDFNFVTTLFQWTKSCFEGEFSGYQAIDVNYHDFEHTLQGTLCMARLLHGRHFSGVKPVLSEHLFRLGLVSIMFHDTGYLKKLGDTDGTGAKYTLIHVDRSCDFTQQYLRSKDYGDENIKTVKNMIHCTGINKNLDKMPFSSELERTIGHGVGTADLLGQMAANDYVENLPLLYLEFAEATHHTNNPNFIGMFTSSEDLIAKTPSFWSNYVFPKINEDFNALYKYLSYPYPDGSNLYLENIQKNISKIQSLQNDTTETLSGSKYFKDDGSAAP